MSDVIKPEPSKIRTSAAVLDVLRKSEQTSPLTMREISAALSNILEVVDLDVIKRRVAPILERYVDAGFVTKEELSEPKNSSKFGYRISDKGRAQLANGSIPTRVAFRNTSFDEESVEEPSEEGSVEIKKAEVEVKTETLSLKNIFKNGERGEISVEKGEKIFSSDDSQDNMLQIMSGIVLVNRGDSSGQFLGGGIVMPGDIVRTSANGEYAWAGTAVTQVTFRRIPRNEFDQAIGKSVIAASELAQNLDVQLQRTRDLMAISQKLYNRTKLATFLLWAQTALSFNETPGDGRFDFPFTLEELSVLLGATRPRLSKNLSRLAREGVIEYIQKPSKGRRSSFRILNIEALKLIANE